MTRVRTVRSLIVAACGAALLPLGMPSAYAHQHPTPADLTGPGVVFIESGYHVQISLIEHNVTTAHINLIERPYDPVLETGSGFVVDPSAVIVTTSAAVAPNEQAARNYAINSIFRTTYPAANYPTLGVPRDLLTQRTFGPDVGGPFDYTPANRLRACYSGRTNSAGGCVITLTQFVTVYPYVTDQAKYGALDAKVLTSTASGIAVVRVSAGSMPAVNLADSNARTYHLGVLGFNAIPDKKHLLQAYKAHLDKVGGTRFKAPEGDNRPFRLVTPAVLKGGLQGGPVAAELGQVIGMISATPVPPSQPGAGGPTLIRTAAIRAVLTDAKVNVSPTHGLADGNYESAMHKFHNQGFAASIQGFRLALTAYPGHFLAAQNLAIALAKTRAGQPGPSVVPSTVVATSPATQTGGQRWWLWLAIGVAVLLIAAGIAWLIRRKRQRPSPAEVAASSAAHGSKEPGPPRPSGAAPPDPRPSSAAGNRSPPTPASSSPSRSGQPSSALLTGSPVRRDPGLISRSPAGASAQPAATKAPTFCTTCGGRLAPHHQFCGWCGDHVGSG
jgi:LPXTG-motif cell wall-anchored protein